MQCRVREGLDYVVYVNEIAAYAGAGQRRQLSPQAMFTNHGDEPGAVLEWSIDSVKTQICYRQAPDLSEVGNRGADRRLADRIMAIRYERGIFEGGRRVQAIFRRTACVDKSSQIHVGYLFHHPDEAQVVGGVDALVVLLKRIGSE
ncbi:hypothetical protein D3C71_1270560 [compost metagenome]